MEERECEWKVNIWCGINHCVSIVQQFFGYVDTTTNLGDVTLGVLYDILRGLLLRENFDNLFPRITHNLSFFICSDMWLIQHIFVSA